MCIAYDPFKWADNYESEEEYFSTSGVNDRSNLQTSFAPEELIKEEERNKNDNNSANYTRTDTKLTNPIG